MGDSCCGGTVDIRALEARQRRVLMIVLAINLATFVMMLAAAIYSGSSSLLSGSLDNLGDALTYLLSLAVFLPAEKLQNALGPRVMTAFERLMGLILSAMAVEMFLAGLREFVKTL